VQYQWLLSNAVIAARFPLEAEAGTIRILVEVIVLVFVELEVVVVVAEE
jgi:hypothetical protein